MQDEGIIEGRDDVVKRTTIEGRDDAGRGHYKC